MLFAAPALSQTTTSYTYDVLGRIIKVTPPSGTPVCYKYDGADNRTSVTGAAECTVTSGSWVNANLTPTANNDFFASYYINPYTEVYDVLANDTDPDLPADSFSLVSVTGSGSGNFSIVTVGGTQMLQWSGTATPGTKNYTYTMKDSTNRTSSATLTIQFILCKPGDECYGS